MLFLTGDLHGTNDIQKLNTRRFPPKGLTREDYLLICGDFGLVWDNSKEDRNWLDWLESKPWTTLWIDGNHENFDLLADYPVTDWHGGQVQYIRPHILHLCRGGLFDIDGRKVFAFGGAESHDKKYRVPGRSYWEQELPSAAEMEKARKRLDEAGWQADIVVTHSMPQHWQAALFGEEIYAHNALTDFFDEIDSKLSFRMWFSGHYHTSRIIDPKHILLYNNIIRLTEDSFVRVYPVLGGPEAQPGELAEAY